MKSILSEEIGLAAGKAAKKEGMFSAEVALPVVQSQAAKKERKNMSGWLDFSRRIARLTDLEELAAEVARAAVELLDVLFCRVMVIQANQAMVCLGNYDRRQGGTSADLIKPLPATTQLIYQRLLIRPSQPVVVRNGMSISSGERWALGLPENGTLGIVPIGWNSEALGLLICGQENGLDNQLPIESRVQEMSDLAEIAAGGLYRMMLERRLRANRLETVSALARVLEARDIYTASQGQRMLEMAERTAARLDYPAAELETIRWAALLHDIGMISVPDEILRRASGLKPEEWMVLRKHPQAGAEIVSAISDLAAVAELIHCHHERYDGKGYPRAISGEHIPLGARIIAVVDAYCMMTDGRSYRPHIGPDEAAEEIRRCSGKNFDPRVVEAFLEL